MLKKFKIIVNHVIFLCITALSQKSFSSESNEWMLLNRSDGCVALDELHIEYPYLRSKNTPQEIFNEINRVDKKSTIQPFLESVLEEISNEKKMTIDEKKFFKEFNKKNAFLVESKKDGIEIILITKKLCNKLLKQNTSK